MTAHKIKRGSPRTYLLAVPVFVLIGVSAWSWWSPAGISMALLTVTSLSGVLLSISAVADDRRSNS